MAEQDEDLPFLSFFLNEPVYLLPEADPVFLPKKNHASESETSVENEPESTESSQDVIEEEAPNQSQGTSLQRPVIEGQNLKGVLILFHHPDAQDLPEASLGLLEKILSAVKLDMNDVARCNWSLLERQQAAQSNIFESLQLIDYQKVIVFGDLPLSWSMSHFFQKYHITEDASGKRLLQADDLAIIAQKRDLKVKLWESLQKLFK